MEETSGEHLRALWEASGMVLGVIWESFKDPGHPLEEKVVISNV